MAERHGPIRTCIGCRQRAARAELCRYVLMHVADGRCIVRRDQDGTRPGRGAWLHDDAECRQLADRRRAFRRALRVAGDVVVDIDQHDAGTHDGDGHVDKPGRGSGR